MKIRGQQVLDAKERLWSLPATATATAPATVTVTAPATANPGANYDNENT